ncbi:hypothetical protein [Streptomyces echinatus]
MMCSGRIGAGEPWQEVVAGQFGGQGSWERSGHARRPRSALALRRP